MQIRRLLPALFLTAVVAACSSGGSSGSVPSTGSGGGPSESGNIFPLQAGATWFYSPNLEYVMKSPVTVNGTTTYPYLGGCDAWEFLYADASGNVYSIGYNLTDDTGPSYVYPQPELLVKKTLHVGETWHESFDLVQNIFTKNTRQHVNLIWARLGAGRVRPLSE